MMTTAICSTSIFNPGRTAFSPGRIDPQRCHRLLPLRRPTHGGTSQISDFEFAFSFASTSVFEFARNPGRPLGNLPTEVEVEAEVYPRSEIWKVGARDV